MNSVGSLETARSLKNGLISESSGASAARSRVLPHNSAASQASGAEPPGILNIPVMPAWDEIAALAAANLACASAA